MIPLTAERAWKPTLRNVISTGKIVRVGGQSTVELLSQQLCVDMNYPVVVNAQRKLDYTFMMREAGWILSGRNQYKDVAEFYWRYAEDGIHVQWAYGPKFVEQVHYVCDVLTKDNNSRQAVISIWRENPRYTPPCTLTLQFIIRGGLLHCIVNMRSSDLWLGLPYDIFAFSMMAKYIQICLMKVSVGFRNPPTVGLLLGSLSIHAGSQHAYERDFEKISKLSENNGPIFDISIHGYNHPDDLIDDLLSKDYAHVNPVFNLMNEYGKLIRTNPGV